MRLLCNDAAKKKLVCPKKKLHASHYNEYERGRFDQPDVLISCYNMISPKQIVTPFDDELPLSTTENVG